MDKPASYPEIAALHSHLKKSNISFEYHSRDEAFLAPLSYRIVVIRTGNAEISMPVYDEYEDVPAMKPLVLFHLVLHECEGFEECASLENWAKDQGLVVDEHVSKLYAILSEAVPRVREVVGHKARAIPWFDFELNTGLARALRSESFE